MCASSFSWRRPFRDPARTLLVPKMDSLSPSLFPQGVPGAGEAEQARGAGSRSVASGPTRLRLPAFHESLESKRWDVVRARSRPLEPTNALPLQVVPALPPPPASSYPAPAPPLSRAPAPAPAPLRSGGARPGGCTRGTRRGSRKGPRVCAKERTRGPAGLRFQGLASALRPRAAQAPGEEVDAGPACSAGRSPSPAPPRPPRMPFYSFGLSF